MSEIQKPSETPAEWGKSASSSEQRNKFFEWIDKLDEKTPIIGAIVPFLKDIKKFFTETLAELFWNTNRKLDDLKTQITQAIGGNYATNKPLTETGVKLMKELDFTESKALAEKVFGTGFATDLLTKLDGGTGMMIKRMIALGQHEWGLKFGRQNPDPKSGFNIGTFQIGGTGSTKETSLEKYKQCYEEGVKLAQANGIQAEPYEKATDAQKDLLAHLWYIHSQRWGEATFAKLRDPQLSDNQVVTLMHSTIQWWIKAIGESVVAQVHTNRIDTTALA